MEFALGFIAGAVALAVYQTWRAKKAGATTGEALKSILSGPGPWRPPK